MTPAYSGPGMEVFCSSAQPWVLQTSTTNAVTPTNLTVPGAPTAVSATAGNASATVNWTAPANGNSTITGYTVTPYIGSTAQPTTTVTGNPAPTTATVSGLTNGTAYTFTVTATNAIGSGPPSAASNAVTPIAPTSPRSTDWCHSYRWQRFCFADVDRARQWWRHHHQLYRHTEQWDAGHRDRIPGACQRHRDGLGQWNDLHVHSYRHQLGRYQCGLRALQSRDASGIDAGLSVHDFRFVDAVGRGQR